MHDLDIRLLKAVQDGIELSIRPYKAVGEELGISEEEVVQRLKALVNEGVIRRFAAAIGHRALGILANAMIVWRVPEEEVERVGWMLASNDQVTHCYERERHADWPYNLYTMIHSRNREDCVKIASQLSAATGIADYKILFSEQEYKKTSARI
jgi:DNA-binding Lrp family transcriptional regulator